MSRRLVCAPGKTQMVKACELIDGGEPLSVTRTVIRLVLPLSAMPDCHVNAPVVG
jgi:hypothetical protein